jgi:hypothetical protein
MAIPDYKRCPKCCPAGVLLPARHFPPNRSRSDGLGSYCRECQREMARASWNRNSDRLVPLHVGRMRDRRRANRERLTEFLLEHPCVDCGESDPVVLEFDHVAGAAKDACVSRLVYDAAAWERIEAEIRKCTVRCANCHRRRHHRDRARTRT